MRTHLSSPKKITLLILFAGMLLSFQQCFALNGNWRKAKPEVPDGVDNDLDGQIDEGYPILSFYADADGDGFGNAEEVLLSTYQKPGFASLPSDCDDADATVNPMAIEVCDGKDNDCDSVTDEGIFKYYYDANNDDCGDDADVFVYLLCDTAPDGYTANPICNEDVHLTLTTSEVQIGEFMGGGGTAGLFMQGSKNPEGRDPTREPWLTVFKTGNYSNLDFGGGGYSAYFHVIPQTSNMYAAGNGWNPLQPPNCNVLQSQLCADFKVNGRDIDFFMACDSLRRITGAKYYIMANIVEGTLEELYWQIDRARGQTIIPIQYNEEGPVHQEMFNYSGYNYAVQAYSFADSVEQRYPLKQFIHVLDIAPLWNPTYGMTVWNSEILSARAIDTLKVGARIYDHGFKFWTITGDPVEDTARVNAGVLQLRATADSIQNSAFRRCKIFVRQLTTNDNAYTPQNIAGTWPLVSFYAQAYKHYIEYSREKLVKYEGANIVGLNRFIDDQDRPNMDWVALGVLHNLFTEQRNALYTSSLGANVDVYGGQKDGVYCIVIQNRSGVDIPMPKNIVFDGMQFNNIAPTFSQCVYADNLYSTSLATYNASQTIEGLSINYFEFTP